MGLWDWPYNAGWEGPDRPHRILDAMRRFQFYHKRVIDLGCHHSRYTYWALKFGASHVWSVDTGISPDYAATLKERGFSSTSFDFVQGDYFDIPWPQADIVLAMGVLYHTYRHFELLERIRATKAKQVIVEAMYLSEPEVFVAKVGDPYVHVPSHGWCIYIFNQLGYQWLQIPSDVPSRTIYLLTL